MRDQVYALRRLTRGLGSSNGAARQGFALALAAAMAAVPEIDTLPSLDLLEAALEVSKSMKVMGPSLLCTRNTGLPGLVPRRKQSAGRHGGSRRGCMNPLQGWC